MSDKETEIYKKLLNNGTFTEDDFLLLSAHLSIVSLTNFTQNVALTDLKSLTRYPANLNSGVHLETKRSLRNQNIEI